MVGTDTMAKEVDKMTEITPKFEDGAVTIVVIMEIQINSTN